MNWDIFRDMMAVSPTYALATIVSTIVMYIAFLVLTRLLGQRILSGLSSFDLAAVIVFGAIVGRATLGPAPTLGAGLVALVTLVLLQATLGQISHTRRGSIINNHAVVLMAGNEIRHQALRDNRIGMDEFASILRIAGIRNDDEVAAVILEPTGEFSVLRRGFLIDPVLLDGVIGADDVPAHLIGR